MENEKKRRKRRKKKRMENEGEREGGKYMNQEKEEGRVRGWRIPGSRVRE